MSEAASNANKTESLVLDFLLKQKKLTTSQVVAVKKILADGQQTLEEIIQDKNYFPVEKLAQVKAGIFNLPYINLVGREVKEEILQLLPQELANNYRLAAFDRSRQDLAVGIVDPGNFKAMEAMDFLARKSKLRVKYHVISEDSLYYILKQYRSLTKEVKQVLTNTIEDLEAELSPTETAEPVEAIIKTAPVTKMVAVILRHAVDGRSSDVHIEPGFDQSRVRYRVDGVLYTSLYLPNYIHNSIISRIKVMANLKTDETRLPQDGRFRLTIEDKEIDFRISIMPLINGQEKAMLRILDTSKKIFTLDQLGFADAGFKIINTSLQSPHGIILVCGPTGSGKTTTLYTILNILNQEAVNIITLEDPVEYFLTGINQSQVRPEINLTFARGLRSILRQDPNIIMVGEIRDQETADLAIHAGLTGHMVLSTIHTNDALGAIPRLMDMQVEPFLITSAVNLIISQRLVRRICPECKVEVKLPADVVAKAKDQVAAISNKELRDKLLSRPLTFYHGQGCPRCNKTGYRGRVVIFELLQMTDALKQIVASGAKPKELIIEFSRQNLPTLRQDGLNKVLTGVTTLEEVLSVT